MPPPTAFGSTTIQPVAGCGETPERLTDQQLRAGGPRLDSGRDIRRQQATRVGGVGAPGGVAVTRQVDRERRQAQREDRRVPGVRVQPRPVQERDDRRGVAVAQRTQRPSVRQGQAEALDPGDRRIDAEIRGLEGQEGELVDGFAHPVILPGPGGCPGPMGRLAS